MIAILSGTTMIGPAKNVEVRVNVRHCTDRIGCRLGAFEVRDKFFALVGRPPELAS